MSSSDLAYKSILEDRVKDIDLEIEKLKKRDNSFLALHTQIANRIKGLQVEREKITDEIKHYVSRDGLSERTEGVVSRFNERYERNAKQQEEFQKRVDELKSAKSLVEGKHANKVLGRRIQKLEDKVNRLKNKNVRLVNAQRKIIFPKYRSTLKKQRDISLQEGKAKNYESIIRDTEALKSSLSEKSIFTPIMSKIYDRREAKYQRKIERATEMINKIQNRESKAHVSGARRACLKNSIANKLRNMADKISPPAPAL